MYWHKQAHTVTGSRRSLWKWQKKLTPRDRKIHSSAVRAVQYAGYVPGASTFLWRCWYARGSAESVDVSEYPKALRFYLHCKRPNIADRGESLLDSRHWREKSRGINDSWCTTMSPFRHTIAHILSHTHKIINLLGVVIKSMQALMCANIPKLYCLIIATWSSYWCIVI